MFGVSAACFLVAAVYLFGRTVNFHDVISLVAA
jgi:hypothetical protein